MSKSVKFLLAFLPLLLFCACSSVTHMGVSQVDRKQMMLVSSETMNEAAVEAYNEVLQKESANLNKDKALYAKVKGISQKLIAEAVFFRPDSKDWQWEVNVITSNTVNAWCMPGGKIVVYSALYYKLNLDDDELAVVIGHEIAHALREHSREQASQDMLKQGALSIASIVGVDNSLLSVTNTLTTLGISLPYSRTHEKEADEIGLELAVRAGYDAKAGARVWQKMAELGSSGTLEILSTHPSNESRIENLQELEQKLESEYNTK